MSQSVRSQSRFSSSRQTGQTAVEEKYRRLLDLIARAGSAAVAFSGGVDSSFLCHAAHEALGEKAGAFTVVSPMLAQREREEAARVAAHIGIAHFLIEENEIDAEVAANGKDRCYHCKKIEFAAIKRSAEERGFAVVFDGSNVDDEGDYRPGLKALAETGVISPLREAGFTKNEIREYSRRAGLPTWDKPAFACLASRVPYGESVDAEKLSRIDRAEEVLREAGFRQFRLRAHGEAGGGIARIEVAPEERRRFFDTAVLDELSRRI
ncbi:MAG: ATP-dependent sacrificial sulfur transferase LarE, partial [Treponema sp.]|nr:ATP-dependent sacrificial sulfur transferase LarE [Treponema sp.]